MFPGGWRGHMCLMGPRPAVVAPSYLRSGVLPPLRPPALVPHRQELCSRGLRGADRVPTAERDLLLEEGELLGHRAEGMRAGQVVPVATVFIHSACRRRLNTQVLKLHVPPQRPGGKVQAGLGWLHLALQALAQRCRQAGRLCSLGGSLNDVYM